MYGESHRHHWLILDILHDHEITPFSDCGACWLQRAVSSPRYDTVRFLIDWN